MFRVPIHLLSGAALLLALTATPSFAGTVSYTDNTSWTAAVNPTSLVTDNFNCSTCAVGIYPAFSNGTNGVTFTGSGAGSFNGVYWLNYASYGGTVLAGGASDGTTPSAVSMTLPTNINALSISLGLANGASGVVTVKADGTVIGTVSVGSTPNFTFYGLTSTNNLGNVSFSSLAGNVVIDNVTFGSLASVAGGGSGGSGGTGDPGGTATADAATMLLAGSGLTALGCGRRWMRSRTTEA